MLSIALTGGIASGKSLVAQHFEAIGMSIVDADTISRDVVAPNTVGLHEVLETFGDWVGSLDGGLDRSALRAHVFADDEARRQLEAIVHPRVRRVTADRLAALAERGCTYAIAVIPLLVETDQAGSYDRTVVVDVPQEVQMQRLQGRDQTDHAQAKRMLARQASRWQRLRHADDVVTNTDALSPAVAIAPQVGALDRKFRLLASRSV